MVLEFWATWCAPCITRIPDLNRLAASVPSSKVVFISVDDEDPSVVEQFSLHRKMDSLLAIDRSDRVFRAYGVSIRPATVVIDGAGRIAAYTTPEELNASLLLKYADAKGVPAKARPLRPAEAPLGAISASVSKIPTSAQQTLFEMSVKTAPASSDGRYSMEHDSEGGVAYRGVRAKDALTLIFGYPPSRFDFIDPPPEGAFDVTVRVGTLEPKLREQLLRSAVAIGLHLQVDEEQHHDQVLVLHTAAASKLQPTASSESPSTCGIVDRRIVLINCPMEKVAHVLERILRTVVVNGTGLSGAYDAEIPLPLEVDLASISAPLLDSGLRLNSEEATYSTFRVRKALSPTPDTSN